MPRASGITAFALPLLLFAVPLSAQHAGHAPDAEQLGMVHFPTSCAPGVARGYIAAVGQLYADYANRDQRSRVIAYELAMADLAARQPDHPGLAHHIIHAYDVPALAPRARAAHAVAHLHPRRSLAGVDQHQPALVRRGTP